MKKGIMLLTASIVGASTFLISEKLKQPKEKIYLRHMYEADLENLPKPDMSGYANFIDNTMFRELQMDQLLSMIIDEKDFVCYLGRPTCPTCDACMELIENAAKTQQQILYVCDTSKEVNRNPIIREELKRRFYNYLEVGDDGKRDLFIPCVVALKNGKVFDIQTGTLDNHGSKENKMTPYEINELLSRYNDLFRNFKLRG